MNIIDYPVVFVYVVAAIIAWLVVVAGYFAVITVGVSIIFILDILNKVEKWYRKI